METVGSRRVRPYGLARHQTRQHIEGNSVMRASG